MTNKHKHLQAFTGERPHCANCGAQHNLSSRGDCPLQAQTRDTALPLRQQLDSYAEDKRLEKELEEWF